MEKITALAVYLFGTEKYVIKDVSDVWFNLAERQNFIHFNGLKYNQILTPDSDVTLYNLNKLPNLQVLYIVENSPLYKHVWGINENCHTDTYSWINMNKTEKSKRFRTHDKCSDLINTPVQLPESLKELHAINTRSLIKFHILPQSLEVIHLPNHHNLTDTYAKTQIAPLKHLIKLTVSSNHLTTADFIHPEAPLEELKATGNEIAKFPAIPETLKLLDLSYNRITELPLDIFPKLDALEEFNIHHNPLYIPLKNYTKGTFAADYSIYVLAVLLQTKSATTIADLQTRLTDRPFVTQVANDTVVKNEKTRIFKCFIYIIILSIITIVFKTCY